MTSSNLNTGTWRRKNALATWSYRLPLADDSSPSRSLCAAAVRLWSALEGFAHVASTEWSTISNGEGARVEPRQGLDAERLRAVCVELGDVTRLEVELDLCCVAVDGSEGVIEDGAWLLLDLDWPEPDTRGEGHPTLTLSVQLNVDIYARETGGVQRDNRALADRNAPRLTAFLRRIGSEVSATLVDIDAYAGRGTVNADGWICA